MSRGRAVVLFNDNAVMFAFMTNRTKPVSAARTMTETFNQHTVQLTTSTLLKVSLRIANDIAYRNAQRPGLLFYHVTAGCDVMNCNYDALFIYIPTEILK